MAGNLKALNIDELKYFLDKYDFTIIDNYILVDCKIMNRKTIHDLNSGFQLSTNIRKMNISKQAIDLWKDKYYGKYNLIEVQNAINTLIITYQSTSESQIDDQLKRTRSKYNNTI